MYHRVIYPLNRTSQFYHSYKQKTLQRNIAEGDGDWFECWSGKEIAKNWPIASNQALIAKSSWFFVYSNLFLPIRLKWVILVFANLRHAVCQCNVCTRFDGDKILLRIGHFCQITMYAYSYSYFELWLEGQECRCSYRGKLTVLTSNRHCTFCTTSPVWTSTPYEIYDKLNKMTLSLWGIVSVTWQDWCLGVNVTGASKVQRAQTSSAK